MRDTLPCIFLGRETDERYAPVYMERAGVEEVRAPALRDVSG
jgi:hypothetical protein